MEGPALVFDIETFNTPAGEGAGAPADAAEEPKKFPPLHQHSIIAIGALWLDERHRMKRLGIFAEGKEERHIIEEFHAFVAGKEPLLVTFNGRKFDVPVLVLRSLRYGIPMPWFFRSRSYSLRYPPTRHLDLCDALADYGAAPFQSLNNVSALLGLRGKMEMDGGLVQEEFMKGNLKKIQSYCLKDVLLTACVYYRWLLVTGAIGREAHNDCIDALAAGVGADERVDDFIVEQNLSSLKV